MDTKRAKELLEKYNQGDCTPEERLIVERFYGSSIETNMETYGEEELKKASARSWASLHNTVAPKYKGRARAILPYISAAAVLFVLVFGYYFFASPDKIDSLTPNDVAVITDVAPGGNYATLTLPNGQQINLSSAPKGAVINSFINIQKSNEGEVVYTSSKNSVAASGEINTIATPKGGQYVVQLADGSRVWLNAATEIKFPADFKNQQNRVIELTGEAYFEVAKNQKQPFVVKTKSQEVQVLGTHFFVNSYPDEQAVRTILREGSVRVFSTQLKKSEILKPGQMAVLHQDKKIEVRPLDEDLIAWKEEGKLKFRDSDLPSLMRTVSKWYNLTVRYEGPISKQRFTAGISRDSNLSELLHILEGMGIHFKIEKQAEETVLIVRN